MFKANVTSTKLSYAELMHFPSFLRFNNVYISNYCLRSHSDGKCELYQKILLPLKPALMDAKETYFEAICQMTDHPHPRKDYAQVLDHMCNQFLPISGSSHSYNFNICFESHSYEKNSAKIAIDRIMQMTNNDRCLSVQIILGFDRQMRLPVKSISNWLNRPDHGNEIKSESKKERQLYMDLGRGDLQNVRQMRDELKKVIYDLNNA